MAATSICSEPTQLHLALAILLTGCAIGSSDDRWVTVERGELVLGVDVSGQLASTESHPLGPPPVQQLWNFKIAFMPPEGGNVAKGMPVLAFDDQELRRQLEEYANEADSATKELTAHEAASRLRARDHELGVAEAEGAERKAELATETGVGLVASNEIKKARLDLELARTTTEMLRRKAEAQARQDRSERDRLTGVKRRAEERVAELQESIAMMRRPAPISGTLLYVVDWQGNKKKIGDNAWRAEKVVEVVSLEDMKADGDVDEMNASKVASGQRVSLRLEANSEIELSGVVAEIEEAVQRRSAEDPRKVVKLEITLDDQDKVELRPGMRFRGTVETERVSDVLVAPLVAVHATPEGAVVYRRSGAGTERVAVAIGRRSADRVEIIGGLSEGDRLAIVDAGGGDDEEPE
jgi:multidrug efflux pump subunit AcrA (membrane-fusion protein)